MSHSPKVIAALEGLLTALKAECGASPTTAARPRGNRTPAIYNYNGGNLYQDMVDCVRRAVRYSRTGKTLSKKERNIMRATVKKFKGVGAFGVKNTNGRDVFTLNGA